jgi:acetyl-CoA C-acetyltransferase
VTRIDPRKRTNITIAKDEGIRPDIDAASLAKISPAFTKEGTVTAGNASSINDGAAMVLLMTRQEAVARGLPILGHVVAGAHAGVDPAYMGIGPVSAVHAALAKAGWTVGDVDLFEANEAFAVQALAVNQLLQLPEEKVNISGGAVALGHPIGASGARILVTLLHSMQRVGAARGVATLCIGGGMGVALCVARAP